ncbi:hypothetical protein GQ43DRAFT_362846 [Delitschia confertaspora ATCC 74209]|uniref:CBM1 domain-containing protein n=1 Tax=Delitschia confertaspora ATCC 74209 TaxID=1513339 RepID=A0A9P4MWK0_9PLEO|nr:hypothetical protein GQ43DRAFT_362846 [Delitschia confertaspora ATCC 74209]
MHHTALATAVVGLLAGLASATNGDWQQCGGINWTGDTTCGSGAGCVKINPNPSPIDYSQCQPGAAPAPAPTPTTLKTSAVPAPTSTSTPSTPGSPAGTGPGTELQSGYYWIRAVEAPNFHKYLQSNPLYGTGSAVLGDYTTAGQFQVVDGQLVQLVSAPGAAVKLLYGTVSQERSFNNQALLLSWSETKNTYGTFGWQGDGLTWSVAGITRPNSIAWYVCTGQQVYINLGNYMYQTPTGCVDETIHYYNDKHANN